MFNSKTFAATLLIITASTLTAGCSSSPTVSDTPTPEPMSNLVASEPKSPEESPDIVLSRMDDLAKRPDWLQESRPFRLEEDKVVSQASVTIPGDHRLEAGYRICFNSAKGNIASAISQRMEFIFQQSSEGTEMDATTAQFIGSEMSSMTSSSLRHANQYYEKLATTNDSGQRKTIYKIFCTVEMPQADFKRELESAMSGAQSKGKISADFKQKVEAQWSRFVNGQDQVQAQAPGNHREVSSGE